jgi:hypothetical protein
VQEADTLYVMSACLLLPCSACLASKLNVIERRHSQNAEIEVGHGPSLVAA